MQDFSSLANLIAKDRSKGNLAVNVGEDLLERVNALVYLRGTSQAELVRGVLERETKEHKKEISTILRVRRKMGPQS